MKAERKKNWWWNLTLILLACALGLGETPPQHTEASNPTDSSRYSVGIPSPTVYGAGACDPARAQSRPTINAPKPLAANTNPPMTPVLQTATQKAPNLEACQNLPAPKGNEDRELTVLGWCVARTRNGGAQKLAQAIVVEFGSSDMDPIMVKHKACELNINPDEIQDKDIECSVTRPPEAKVN